MILPGLRSMKRIVLLLSIIVSACKYNDMPANICEVRDPANDLPWLKEEIQNLEQSSIREYFRVEKVEYNGETGFYISNCCPFCDTIPIFYKCSGDHVIVTDLSKLVLKGVIWQPADFSCLMN